MSRRNLTRHTGSAMRWQSAGTARHHHHRRGDDAAVWIGDAASRPAVTVPMTDDPETVSIGNGAVFGGPAHSSTTASDVGRRQRPHEGPGGGVPAGRGDGPPVDGSVETSAQQLETGNQSEK